ncbi:MAG TPA: MauE/DoxX family redox-associated membrane protein [Chloroflexota bacterium]|jgi:hypothetical protein
MITIGPRSRYLALAFRLFLAVVFLIAGGSKLAHANLFVDTVKGYKMLPGSLVRPFGLALPWIEVLVGLYLLVGLFTRLAALAAGVFLVIFLFALGVQIAHGHTGDCGCVVGIDNPVITAFIGGNNIGPWDLIRDSILVLMAAFVALAPRPLLAVDGWLQARREAEEDQYYEHDAAGSPVA